MPKWTKGALLAVVGLLVLAVLLEPDFLRGEAEGELGDLPVASSSDAAGDGSSEAATVNGSTDVQTAEGADIADAAPTPPPEVMALFERIEADPGDSEAWKELAGMLVDAGDYLRAAEAYAAAVEADPDDGAARAGLGKALLFQGFVRVARAELIRAVELDPENPEARLNLGITYSHSAPANISAARAEWSLVVELAPDTELAASAQQYLDTYLEEGPAESDQASDQSSDQASAAQ